MSLHVNKHSWENKVTVLTVLLWLNKGQRWIIRLVIMLNSAIILIRTKEITVYDSKLHFVYNSVNQMTQKALVCACQSVSFAMDRTACWASCFISWAKEKALVVVFKTCLNRRAFWTSQQHWVNIVHTLLSHWAYSLANTSSQTHAHAAHQHWYTALGWELIFLAAWP